MPQYDLAGNPLPEQTSTRTDLDGNPMPTNQSPYNQAPNGFGQQPGGYGQARAYESVNGSTIQILGIVSIFFGILGPVAWIMGNSALAKIDSGQGDPAERSAVTTGRTIGMIVTILGIIGIVLGIVALVFGLSGVSHGVPQ